VALNPENLEGAVVRPTHQDKSPVQRFFGAAFAATLAGCAE